MDKKRNKKKKEGGREEAYMCQQIKDLDLRLQHCREGVAAVRSDLLSVCVRFIPAFGFI